MGQILVFILPCSQCEFCGAFCVATLQVSDGVTRLTSCSQDRPRPPRVQAWCFWVQPSQQSGYYGREKLKAGLGNKAPYAPDAFWTSAFPCQRTGVRRVRAGPSPLKRDMGRMGRAFFENTHTHALYIRATHRWNERCFVSHGTPCFVVLI